MKTKQLQPILNRQAGSIIKVHNEFAVAHVIKKKRVAPSTKHRIMQNRIMYYVLSMIHKSDDDFYKFQFSLRDFVNYLPSTIKFQKTTMNKLLKAIEDIQSLRKVFVIKDDSGESKLVARVVFPTVEVVLNQDLTTTVTINPELKPYLLKLNSNFCEIELKEYLTLPSHYSQIFYDKISQLSGFDPNKIKPTPLKDLYDLLELPDTMRNNFKDFHRDILKKAQKDLENTERAFKYKLVKLQKTVTHILFIPDKQLRLNL